MRDRQTQLRVLAFTVDTQIKLFQRYNISGDNNRILVVKLHQHLGWLFWIQFSFSSDVYQIGPKATMVEPGSFAFSLPSYVRNSYTSSQLFELSAN
ncbi:hypothetical protein AB3S75_004573 [Citrus x aurantiifolia]